MADNAAPSSSVSKVEPIINDVKNSNKSLNTASKFKVVSVLRNCLDMNFVSHFVF